VTNRQPWLIASPAVGRPAQHRPRRRARKTDLRKSNGIGCYPDEQIDGSRVADVVRHDVTWQERQAYVRGFQLSRQPGYRGTEVWLAGSD
jgi:hypothetical protein